MSYLFCYRLYYFSGLINFIILTFLYCRTVIVIDLTKMEYHWHLMIISKR